MTLSVALAIIYSRANLRIYRDIYVYRCTEKNIMEECNQHAGIRLKIRDLDQFINCIHDYIIDEFGIHPRDFETKLLVGSKALVWDQRTDVLCEIHCPQFNGKLHVHEQYMREESKPYLVMCCCEVDVIAMRYLLGSIFDKQKSRIISTMHNWLPAATMHHVDVKLIGNPVRAISYFEPSYLFRFYDDDDDVYNPGKFRDHIDYTYIIRNIVYSKVQYPDDDFYRDKHRAKIQNKPQPNIVIMARRRRSRSRSRSRSPSRRTGVQKRRSSRSGRRRRRRSQSPAPSYGAVTVGYTSNGGGRRRRSRSRSR